ncbi:MAG TPA: hypothetical protein VHE83_19610 [Mycobacteriales bacterium]|nr:hypothetical protein [Mycobacteriales bacterium]
MSPAPSPLRPVTTGTLRVATVVLHNYRCFTGWHDIAVDIAQHHPSMGSHYQRLCGPSRNTVLQAVLVVLCGPRAERIAFTVGRDESTDVAYRRFIEGALSRAALREGQRCMSGRVDLDTEDGRRTTVVRVWRFAPDGSIADERVVRLDERGRIELHDSTDDAVEALLYKTAPLPALNSLAGSACHRSCPCTAGAAVTPLLIPRQRGPVRGSDAGRVRRAHELAGLPERSR